VGLRHPGFRTESELVRRRLADLVLERQKLRDERAAEVLLEQNRLDIVQAQQDIAHALVSEHVGATAA